MLTPLPANPPAPGCPYNMHSDLDFIYKQLQVSPTDVTMLLQKIDDDINTFSAINNSDLSLLDTDLNVFATANHADLAVLDTDLQSIDAQLLNVNSALNDIRPIRLSLYPAGASSIAFVSAATPALAFTALYNALNTVGKRLTSWNVTYTATEGYTIFYTFYN